MKDDKFPKIVLFDQPYRAKQKAGRSRMGWEEVVRKDLREIGTYWEGERRRLRIDWDGRRMCVAVSASGNWLLQSVVSSSSSIQCIKSNS